MGAFTTEEVRSVRHWNDSLFSFTTTRSGGFRFRNGHFAMIGLSVAGKPLLRAYSMASANYDEELEFYSIKVPGGALTSQLQHIKVGDEVLIGRKPTGTLIIDNLKQGKRLYLLSTGTGLAPFMSIVRDPETYEKFEQVILVHGVRHISDLGYREELEGKLSDHPLVSEEAAKQLLYYPTVTRETFRNQGRVTDLIDNGKLFSDLGVPSFDPAHDRVMICGNPAMLSGLSERLEALGFGEGNTDHQGEYVIERAFVEK